MAASDAAQRPEQAAPRRWKLAPEEIPPELKDNDFLQMCTQLTDADEALLAELAELDQRDP